MSNNLFEIDKKKITVEEPDDAYNPDVSIETEIGNAVKTLDRLDKNLSSDTPNKTSDVSEDTLAIIMGDDWDGYFSDMADIVSNEAGRITDEICCYDSIGAYLTSQKNMLEQETVGSAKTIVNNTLVKQLDKEYRVDNIYVIGDTTISRPKFLRNFESAQGNPNYLIASLVSNSILDEKEYYNLTNELKTKKKTKK